ncbi:trichohyalin-like, partial [Camellia sinensis]|uniref:trichohyalin-like n=1 Tax=Camellia sinensis TaxID=4442 RepID=UPI001035BB90
MSPFLAFTTEAMRLLEEEPSSVDKVNSNREKVLEKKGKTKKGFPQIIWLKDQWRKSKKEKDQQPMSPFLVFATEAKKLLEEEQDLQLTKKKEDPLKRRYHLWGERHLMEARAQRENGLKRKTKKKKVFPQIMASKISGERAKKKKISKQCHAFLAFTTEAMRAVGEDSIFQLKKKKKRSLETKDIYGETLWRQDQEEKKDPLKAETSMEKKTSMEVQGFRRSTTEAMKAVGEEQHLQLKSKFRNWALFIFAEKCRENERLYKGTREKCRKKDRRRKASPNHLAQRSVEKEQERKGSAAIVSVSGVTTEAMSCWRKSSIFSRKENKGSVETEDIYGGQAQNREKELEKKARQERLPPNHMAQRSVEKEQERKGSATNVSVFGVATEAMKLEKELEKKDKKKKGFPQIIWLKDQWRKSKKEKDQQAMSPFLAFTTEAMRLLEEEPHLQLTKKKEDPLKPKTSMEEETSKEARLRNREKELEKKDKTKKGFPQIIWLKDQRRKGKKEKDQEPMSPYLAFTTESMRLLEEEQHLQLTKEKELEKKDKKKKGFPQIIWLKDQWRKSKKEKDQQAMSPFLAFTTEAMRLKKKDPLKLKTSMVEETSMEARIRNREKELEKKDKTKKGFPQIIWLKDQRRKSNKENDQEPMSPSLAFTKESMRLLEEEQHLQLTKGKKRSIETEDIYGEEDIYGGQAQVLFIFVRNWTYLSLLRKCRENEGALERNREKELEKKDKKKKGFPQILWLKNQWRKSKKEKDQQPMSSFLAFTTEGMRQLEEEQHLQLKKEKELEKKDKKKKGLPQIIWLKDQWRKSKKEKEQQPMSPFLTFTTEAMRLLEEEQHLQLKKKKKDPLKRKTSTEEETSMEARLR